MKDKYLYHQRIKKNIRFSRDGSIGRKFMFPIQNFPFHAFDISAGILLSISNFHDPRPGKTRWWEIKT